MSKIGKVYFEMNISGGNFYFGQIKGTDHDFQISCYRDDGLKIFDEVVECTPLNAATIFVKESNRLLCQSNSVVFLYVPPGTDGRTIWTDIVGVI